MLRWLGWISRLFLRSTINFETGRMVGDWWMTWWLVWGLKVGWCSSLFLLEDWFTGVRRILSCRMKSVGGFKEYWMSMEGGVLCVPDWDWHSIVEEAIGKFDPLWHPIHFPTLKRGGWLKTLGWLVCWSVICGLVDVALVLGPFLVTGGLVCRFGVYSMIHRQLRTLGLYLYRGLTKLWCSSSLRYPNQYH